MIVKRTLRRAQEYFLKSSDNSWFAKDWKMNIIQWFKLYYSDMACIFIMTHDEDMEGKNCARAVTVFISN